MTSPYSLGPKLNKRVKNSLSVSIYLFLLCFLSQKEENTAVAVMPTLFGDFVEPTSPYWRPEERLSLQGTFLFCFVHCYCSWCFVVWQSMALCYPGPCLDSFFSSKPPFWETIRCFKGRWIHSMLLENSWSLENKQISSFRVSTKPDSVGLSTFFFFNFYFF